MKKITLIIFIIIGVISCSNKGCKENNNVRMPGVAIVSVEPIPNIKKPIINVYLENSGSIDGYIKGFTEFEQAVYSYLSDIKISDLTDEMNLFYINSDVIPTENEISDFIEKLEPTSFKARGGNRGTSDISDVLKSILSETNDSTVSIMVSDCIFSPGKNKDANQYLMNQQIGIKSSFAEYLKKRDLAVIVYQLTSQFDGIYFNRENKPIQINDKRPFYIWLIGNQNYIKEITSKVDVNKIKGSGVQNIFVANNTDKKLSYGILQSPKLGTFSLVDSKKIAKAKGDSNGLLFSVGVDFSLFILDNSYLIDNLNYKVSNPSYSVEILKTKTKNYTHTMKISTIHKIITPTNIKIQLLNRLPDWIEEYNDDEGLDIFKNDAMNKTYGIKYLIGGVYDAFTTQNNIYAELSVSVN